MANVQYMPLWKVADLVVVLISPSFSSKASTSSLVISPTILVILWDWASIALLMVTDLAFVEHIESLFWFHWERTVTILHEVAVMLDVFGRILFFCYLCLMFYCWLIIMSAQPKWYSITMKRTWLVDGLSMACCWWSHISSGITIGDVWCKFLSCTSVLILLMYIPH